MIKTSFLEHIHAARHAQLRWVLERRVRCASHRHVSPSTSVSYPGAAENTPCCGIDALPLRSQAWQRTPASLGGL